MAYIRKVFTGFILVLPLIFSSLIFSESSDYNMPIGVTDVSESIFGLHMLIFWICYWSNRFLDNVLVLMEV